MPAEPLHIFDPRRNFQLQGFSGRAATTTMHDATEAGLSISGIFQAAEDFAVLCLHNAYDYFNHLRLKPLPGTDLAGLKLEFDIEYDHTIDSAATLYSPVDAFSSARSGLSRTASRSTATRRMPSISDANSSMARSAPSGIRRSPSRRGTSSSPTPTSPASGARSIPGPPTPPAPIAVGSNRYSAPWWSLNDFSRDVPASTAGHRT